MLKNPYNFHLTQVYGFPLTKNERFIIFTPDPHPQSPAALLLLKNHFKNISRSLNKISPDRRIWLTFRNRLLKRILKQEGDLVCFYCKKGNLLANVNSVHAHGRKATLDHIMPLSKGGSEFDEKNIAVCCDSCNQKKKDLLPEEFIARLKKSQI